MPDWSSILPIGLAAALYCTVLGVPLARRTLPEALPAAAFGPILGWAVHTAIAAACLPWIGFDRPRIAGLAVLLAAGVWTGDRLAARPRALQPGLAQRRLPAWLNAMAALLACLPAAAIVPKGAGDEVRLAAPIFDHAKIAAVDAIARLGLPAVNPFYGGAEIGPHLPYYFWWHLGAAELGRGFGVTGWTADAALTWFTAYASLMLLAGIGWALGGRAVAALAMLLALPASLRPLAAPFEHAGWLLPATGLGAWLNQASWAPQHLAASGCLVLAALVLAGSRDRPAIIGVAVLACLIASGFGASAWVGGVVAAVALPVAALWLGGALDRRRRRAYLLGCAVAAIWALALVSPLLRDQAAATLARSGGSPVALAAFPVLGAAVPAGLRPVLDVVAFPLLLLIEFPVVAVLGLAGLVVAGRDRRSGWPAALAATGLTGLAVCWCARSTIENNDLGWRAVLPLLLAATPFAAQAVLRLWTRRRPAAIALASLPPLLGLIGAWPQLRNNWAGQPAAPQAGFARSAPAWAALRVASGPADRVASDPMLAARTTPWPANIAWALLADRPSCYSGWATARAFVPLPGLRLYALDQELGRVFAGAPQAGDVADLAHRLGCRFALVTPESGAWRHDPFAADPAYRLVGSQTGRWRLYRAE